MTDIATELSRKAERMSRFYATLSEVNAAIVRCTGESELYDAICAVLSDKGGFTFAAVACPDWPSRRVPIVACVGQVDLTNHMVEFDLADPERATLVRLALLSGETRTSGDIVEDPRVGNSIRDMYAAIGVHSVSAVVIRRSGDIAAAMVIASTEKDFFTAEILGLIEDVGRNVSFALDNFARERERREAQKALRDSALENFKQAEQKRLAEEAVARSEQHLNVTLRSIGDAVLVTDTAGRVTLMNPVAEALTGWREGAARGRPANEVFHIVNQQTGELAESPVDRVLREGVVVGLANHTVLIAKDGTERPIADSGAPIRHSEGGEVVGVVLVFRDQSEEYRMQKALRDSEQLYSSLASNVPIGIYVTDTGGELTYGNPNFLNTLGLKPEELSTAAAAALIHPDDCERVSQAWYAACQTNGITDFGVYRYLRPDGRPIWVRGMATALSDEEGCIVRMTGVVTDITAEQEHLRDIERLSRFESTLRQVNSAIAYCGDERSLFDSICRVFARPGEFSAASLYVVDRAARRVDLAVYYGAQEQFAREYAGSLSLDQDDDYWTLATDAIRNGGTAVSGNLKTDSRLPPHLHEAAQRYGMTSGFALPLYRFGEPVAALVLYSTEPTYFRGDIVALLRDIGRDVSHALEAIANRRRRDEAELAVARSEERLRLGLSLTRTGMYEVNYATGRVTLDAVSAQLMNLGDDAIEADIGSFADLLAEHTRHAIDGRRIIEEFLAGKRDSFSAEFAVTLPDGTARWLHNYGALTAERTAPGLPVRMLGVTSDITAAKALEERNRIAAAVFDTSGEAILITDADRTILLANQAFARMSGYTPEESIGRRQFSPHRSALHDERFYAEIEETLQRDGIWQGEIWRQRKDDTVYPVLATVSLVRDNRDKVAHYVVQEIDISSQKEFEQRISRLAYRDPLTDLPNRTLLRDRIEQSIAAAHREQNTLALLFLDLDHFKNINDSLGHAVGDRLLEEIARRLIASTREADTVGRLGGDEFLVLLPNADADAAAHVAQKLLQECARPFVFGSHNLTVTPSVGIALYPKDGANFDELLKTADTAMYRAKDEGRNAYRFYTPEMNQAVFQRMMLESSLRRAIDNREFVLHYQPKFELRSHTLIGTEALIRWHQPEMGVVSPAQFIPVAEESGLIEAIGKWALEEACRQIKRWQKQGLPLVPVSVNFSARQFAARNIIELVHAILKKTGLPGSALEIEITESLLAHDMDYTFEVLTELKKLGVHMAIDDFGTGYSSLSYLKRFPIDRLKIDQSFVRDLVADADDRAIAAAVVTMGHSLGMRVIAEGVETLEQMAILAEMGCDEVQGYLLGRPIPAHDMEVALRKYVAMSSRAG